MGTGLEGVELAAAVNCACEMRLCNTIQVAIRRRLSKVPLFAHAE